MNSFPRMVLNRGYPTLASFFLLTHPRQNPKMLTKGDLQRNLRFLSLGCKLGILPFKVDHAKGELKLLKSNEEKAICWFMFFWYILHALYIVLRLSFLLLIGAQISLTSRLWHFTVSVGAPTVIFCNSANFRWPGITVTCFNMAVRTEEDKDEGQYNFRYQMH